MESARPAIAMAKNTASKPCAGSLGNSIRRAARPRWCRPASIGWRHSVEQRSAPMTRRCWRFSTRRRWVRRQGSKRPGREAYCSRLRKKRERNVVGVTLEVAIGSVDRPGPALGGRAQQEIDGASDDAVGPACIAHFGRAFIVLDLKGNIRKGTQLLLQTGKLLRKSDPRQEFLPNRA